MMTRFLILFAFFSFFIGFQQVRSQDYIPGSWTTASGDSVSGFIQNRIQNGRFISVKKTEEAKPEKKSADDIIRVYQNGLLTVSSYTLLIKGKRNNIFLELLSGGNEIGLYTGKDQTLGKIYAVRKYGEITVLTEQNLTSNYSYLYSDCSTISLGKSYVYVEKYIVSEFEDYLSCKGLPENSDENLRKQPETALLVGPVFGYTFGNVNFPEDSYYSRGDYSTITSTKFGLAAQYVLSPRISLGTQISYLNKTASSDSVNTPPTFEPEVYSTLVQFDFDVLDWQLYAVFGLLNKPNFSLNAGVGMNLGFILNSNFTQEANGYWVQDDGPPTLDFEDSREVGFLLSIGGVVYTKNKNQIQLNVKYNMTTMGYDLYRDSQVIGGIGAGSTSLQTSMIEISANYLFKVTK